MPRLHEGDRRVVIDRVRVHRAQHAQIVDHLAGPRKRVADLGAALAAPLEVPLRWRDREGRLLRRHRRQALALPHRLGQLRAVEVTQLRLPVPRLELAGRARHTQVDDALRLRREVRHAGQASETNLFTVATRERAG